MEPADKRSPLTLTHWLILIIASIGFAFDIYEILMAPLVVGPALKELGGILPGTDAFALWRSLLFYVPAIAGGIFGLLGGYLTDRLGRRRVLTWSILLYATSAFLAGFSTSAIMLLVLRCTTFIGVCVEFVAAVAWLAELFPDPKQRERALGYSQAFSSLGGLLVALANGFILDRGAAFPAIAIPEFLTGLLGTIAADHQHEAWRYTLMSGLVPAIPLIIIRPFLPESPVWQKKKEEGKLRRPNLWELFSPQFRRTTIVTTLMFACSYGAAFGAIQNIPELVKGLEAVKQSVADKKPPEAAKIQQKVGAEYTKVQELGGLTGRFLLAILVVRIASRRSLLRVFQLPGLFLVPLVFYFFHSMPNTEFFTIDLSSIYLGKFPFTTVSFGVFLAGLVTVAQFSFWGNYLPLVFPLHLRGTGESFAANIGGRAIGVGFLAVSTTLANFPFIPGDSPPVKLALASAIVATFVFGVGSILCCFLPEPTHQDLSE